MSIMQQMGRNFHAKLHPNCLLSHISSVPLRFFSLPLLLFLLLTHLPCRPSVGRMVVPSGFGIIILLYNIRLIRRSYAKQRHYLSHHPPLPSSIHYHPLVGIQFPICVGVSLGELDLFAPPTRFTYLLAGILISHSF